MKRSNKKQKILFTGMSGYLGKNFLGKINELKEFDIVCLSRRKISGLSTVLGDFLDKQNLDIALKGVHTVVHMASETSSDSKDLYNTNVIGTRNIVEAAKKNKVKRFIYISSTSVLHYPDKPYQKSKLQAEGLVKKDFPNYIIIRPSEIYGGIDSQHYTLHIKKIRKGGLVFLSSGDHYVQPVYVGDVVKAIIKVIKSKETGTYIVAGKKPIKQSEVYKILKDKFNKNCTLIFTPNFIAYIVINIIYPLIGKKKSWENYKEGLINRTYKSDFDTLSFEEGADYLI